MDNMQIPDILHSLIRNSIRMRTNYTADGAEAVIVVEGQEYLVSIKPNLDECEHLNQTERMDDGHLVVDCDDCKADIDV